MAKQKQPYIPLYIGDWEQDTNCISLEAEGALLKLTFKLWKSDTKGLLTISFNQLSILLKKTQEIAIKILKELQENAILNIVFRDNNIVEIGSRRMLKEAAISGVRSEIGSKGGNTKKQTKSKTKAKGKQNPDIDNDIDNIIYYSINKGLKVSENFFHRVWFVWTAHKKNQFKFEFKKLESEFTAVKELYDMCKGNEYEAEKIVQKSITSGWKGLFPLKEDNNTPVFQRQQEAGNKAVGNIILKVESAK